MARTVPTQTPAQLEQAERRQALISGDVARLRAWAARYGLPLLGDDAQIELSMHEARVLDPGIPPRVRSASRTWLKQHAPNSTALKAR